MPAFCQCGFFSESLGSCVSANVIVPQNSKSNIGVAQLDSSKKLFPVIYLFGFGIKVMLALKNEFRNISSSSCF